MITAYGTIESAVAATKQGAFYYFTKPFKNDEVLAVLRNAIERRRLVRENRELRDRLRAGAHRFDEIIGGSAQMKTLFDLIARAAPSRATVLVAGRERHRQGTGGARVPSAFGAGRQGVRHRQLGQPAAGPARIEPVRPREGRVHRRGVPEEGPVRAGRQGHDLLRRDRQHPDRHAVQAAARDPGARVHAARRRGHHQGGRADHRGHQRRPARNDRAGKIPRGPVLPPERHHRRTAAAARSPRGHSAARAALPRQVQPRRAGGTR